MAREIVVTDAPLACIPVTNHVASPLFNFIIARNKTGVNLAPAKVQLQYDGGSLLWGKNGFITYLELYAFADQFDEQSTEFVLSP